MLKSINQKIRLYYFTNVDVNKLIDDFYIYIKEINFKTNTLPETLVHKIYCLIHIIIDKYYESDDKSIDLNVHILNDTLRLDVKPLMDVLEYNKIIVREYNNKYHNIKIGDGYVDYIAKDPETRRARALRYISSYEKRSSNVHLKLVNDRNNAYQRKFKKKLRKKLKKERIKQKAKEERQAIRQKMAEERAALKAASKPPKKERLTNQYCVVLSRNNKIVKKLGLFKTYSDAMNMYNQKIKESECVIYPKKYLNKVLNNEKKLWSADIELLLLKKNDIDEVELKETYFPNNVGKLVKNTLSGIEQWYIYDKTNIEVEESFAIYGIPTNFKKDARRDYNYILNELVINNPSNSILRQVVIYRNKLIIMHDFDDFDLITTKSFEESVRLYSQLEEDCKRLKINTIFFSSVFRYTNKEIEEIIINKTGWSLSRIYRNSTSHDR